MHTFLHISFICKMPLINRDFWDEERHHQAGALHRPPSAGGVGTSLYHDYQNHRPHHPDHHQSSPNSLWNSNCTETLQSSGQDSLLGVALVDFERFIASRHLSIWNLPVTNRDFLDEERHHQAVALYRPPSAGGAPAADGADLYHDYQQYLPQHNSQQSSRNSSLSNNCDETIQSGRRSSLLGMSLLEDLGRGLYRSQVVSRRTSLQNFIHFSPQSSDQSLVVTPETITEVLGDIESLFDDDEAPSSSQKAQVAASRRPGATNQEGQQQTRDYVNLSPPKQAWQRDLAISGMVTSTQNHPSSLVTTKVAIVPTNTQGRQEHTLAGKKGLKRRGLQLNDYSPCAKNAPAHSSAALFMTEKNVPVTKKPRHCTPVDDESKSEEGESLSEDRRFHSYQAERWAELFAELCAFREEQGNCQVPNYYPKNPALARWVKRQRYQQKLKTEGKMSTMTDKRMEQLEKVGFAWDSHSSAWVERFKELCTFRERAGHCNVPSNFADSPSLATWVKCQRRQYKLFWQYKTSNINLHRIEQLHDIGFEWVLRGPGSKTSSQQL
jgi:hypothetical protein